MTAPVVQRLRDAAAAMQEGRVSMQAMAQAHAPRLLRVPCVGTVLGLGMAALAVDDQRPPSQQV